MIVNSAGNWLKLDRWSNFENTVKFFSRWRWVFWTLCSAIFCASYERLGCIIRFAHRDRLDLPGQSNFRYVTSKIVRWYYSMDLRKGLSHGIHKYEVKDHFRLYWGVYTYAPMQHFYSTVTLILYNMAGQSTRIEHDQELLGPFDISSISWSMSAHQWFAFYHAIMTS